MSENQHTEQDMMFRSILENGQEEVPVRVWDGVSSGLDRIARRKKAILWFRRAAVSVSAAAAIAAGVIFSIPSEEPMILAEKNEVSVERQAEDGEQTALLAYAPEATSVPVRQAEVVAIGKREGYAAQSTDTQEEIVNIEACADVPEQAEAPVRNAENKTTVAETFTTDEWIEEEPVKRRKIKAAFVLSSTTGAAGQGKASSSGMLRRPISPATMIQTGVTEISDNSFGLPLSFGVGAKIDITKRWSIGIGVNYTLLTRKFEGDYMKVEKGEILEYIQSDIRNMQHYIGIPVNVYYNIISAEKINFYAYAGGAVEKGLVDEYQILSSKSVYKKQIQGVQWSANLGLGVEFMLGRHLGLYLDPSAKYYFNCNQPKSIRTSEPFMFGCEIGLRTRF
jgi:hypothetical protein